MKQFLLASLLLFGFQSFSQTLEDDRLALVALYNAANGPEWLDNNWVIPGSPGNNPCGWSGVTCENGRVTSVDVSGETLKGTLPSAIGKLTALKKLLINARFSTTRLTGDIPVELGNLTNLEELDIAGHAFSSKNFQVIGQLVNLKTLWFTPLWSIPNQLFTLPKIETLVLSLGQASERVPIGPFPVGITKLTTLKTLVISSMGYTGQLPVELGNLTQLKLLVIGETFLEGRIPATIGNLTNLTQLGINGILYAGPIPPEIGKLRKLIGLHLNYNTHTGPIPSEINGLVNAIEISLEGNHLTSPLPDLSALKPGIINAEMNSFNFDGLEGHIDRFVYGGYLKQLEIPLYKVNDYYYVNAGGTQAKNTYKWYVNGALEATIVGDNRFYSTKTGAHRVEITNLDIPLLTLSSTTIGSALPVNLISFRGESGVNENRLIWETSSEVANKGFEIEKSADARTFHKIAFVDGNGNSNELKNYHYTDQNPFDITYYRLKQLDYDGKFEYSKIIIARNVPDIKVYPNPARDYIVISGLDMESNFQILGLDGHAVLSGKTKPAAQISVKQLPTGAYILKIGEKTKKLVINK
ncbi:T9SS type A sorting domain-containing protein [Dyadobacter sp. CY326]|uniref:T9SS type A sorting domain-containing protein n=1 Tax=Dyadobacter sp. CY326 TaxID=2907300 RepID=UPI001F461730|nr:T9SS type A sorting domain-containing protein [Dyadobacter sp. CY326]MCE7065390.1 T9SS type A sorting domain-containing protein [Dyadobacter sp. CY326]